jgi:hypothetical protein
MTQKEVTTIMYQQLKQANNLETRTINDKFYHIFKESMDDKFMICVFSGLSGNSHSEILTSFEECYDWINQNS